TTSSPRGHGATASWDRSAGGRASRPPPGRSARPTPACPPSRARSFMASATSRPRAAGARPAAPPGGTSGWGRAPTPPAAPAASVGDLLDFAIALVPGLADAPLERSWAGLRPGSPDGLPFLGRVPGVANLSVAAGHFRAGIQLSPGTATVMTELILGRPTTIPLEAFRLDCLGSPSRARSAAE